MPTRHPVVMNPSATYRRLVPVERLSSPITSVDKVYVIAHMGIARVDAAHWRLAIDGLVATLGKDAMQVLDESPRAVSMVIDPTGEPVSDILADREGLLYASIDTRACVEPKQFHDVVGYYNRFDVFHLTVDRTRQRPVSFKEMETMPPSPAREIEGNAPPVRAESMASPQ